MQARALFGFWRPYVRASQGQLLAQAYGPDNSFTCAIAVDSTIAAPTEVFIPPGLAIKAMTVDGGPYRWSESGAILLLELKIGHHNCRLQLVSL